MRSCLMRSIDWRAYVVLMEQLSWNSIMASAAMGATASGLARLGEVRLVRERAGDQL